MDPKVERAYKAWQRAVRARVNRAIRNAPENIVDFKRSEQRIRDLKAKYEAALEATKHSK